MRGCCPDASAGPVRRRLFNIAIHLGMEVQQVDLGEKKVRLVDGCRLEAHVLFCGSCKKKKKKCQ